MTLLTRLLNSSSLLGLAAFEGEGAGSAPPAGGEAAVAPPAATMTAEASTPPAAQTLNPQVGSTADPEGMLDETADWVVDAFSEMQRPTLDDVIHSPPPTATPPVAPPVNPNPQAPPVAQATQPPAQPAPIAPAPTATPVTAQPAPPTLTAQPPPTVQLPGGTVPQPPAVPQPTAVPPDQVFDQLGQAIAANKDALAQQLATAVYTVPQETLDRLGLNAEQGKLLSQLMATVQVQATGSIMRLFTQQMPNYVNGLLQRNSAVQDGERQFWADNPHLNSAEHSQLAIQVGTMYRKLNPTASRADFNKFVGDYVGMQIGKVRGAVQASPPANQVASLPPVQTPGRVVRPNGHIPYSPAGSNNAPPGALPAPQDTEWGRMMDQISKMDQGFFDR